MPPCNKPPPLGQTALGTRKRNFPRISCLCYIYLVVTASRQSVAVHVCVSKAAHLKLGQMSVLPPKEA